MTSNVAIEITLCRNVFECANLSTVSVTVYKLLLCRIFININRLTIIKTKKEEKSKGKLLEQNAKSNQYRVLSLLWRVID